MLTAVYVLVGILIVAGFEPVGYGRLMILVGIAAIAYALDYTAGAMGAKKFGGSRWAVVGALLGAVVGIFFGPAGLVLGPVIGAVAGELVRSRQIGNSVKSGLGTVVGMLVGTVAKLSLAIVMAGLFLWWVWQA
jgi:uncharacterized protein YqgC (DUF456 family)